MHQFSVVKRYPFSASRMWTIFSDFSKSSNPSATITILDPGDPENHQIGAVRETTIGKDVFSEQLVDFEPGTSLTYKLLSGAPVDQYYGTIRIDPAGDSEAEVLWTVRCVPKFPIPGWIIEKNAKKVIRGILDELYKELTQQ